jgi:hypothetical protein
VLLSAGCLVVKPDSPRTTVIANCSLFIAQLNKRKRKNEKREMKKVVVAINNV